MNGVLPVSRPFPLLLFLALLAVPIMGLGEGAVELSDLGGLNGVPDNGAANGVVIAVAFDPDGSFFVLESAGGRLIHAARDGKFLQQTGGFGFGDDSFNNPGDAALIGFEIWVTDPVARGIVRFDRRFVSLGALRGVEDPLTGDSLQFDRPVSVARAKNGDIIVLERDRQEILLLSLRGQLVDRFGGFGETNKGMVSPRKVRVAADGTIAVADPGREVVMLFNRFGSPRGYFPIPWGGGGPNGLAWEGTRLWVAGDEGLALLDERGKVLQTWPAERFGGRVNDVAVDGDLLAIAVNDTVKLFRIR